MVALIEELARHAYDVATRVWERAWLAFGAFAAPYGERLERRHAKSASRRDADTLRLIAQRTANDDLYLALACLAKVTAAWDGLCDREIPRLRALARARGCDDETAESLSVDLVGDLLARRADGRTLLDSYDGAATLFGWLAAICLRRIIAKRSGRAPSSFEAAFPTLPAASEEASTIEERRDETRSLVLAFDAACKKLTSREAIALALKYRDELSQRDIAGRLEVGEARVSQLLAQAVKKVREEMERCVPERFRASPGSTSWGAWRDAIADSLASFGSATHNPAKGRRP